MTALIRRAAGGLLAFALLASLLTGAELGWTQSTAAADPVTGFEPGYILSDSILYDSRTMSANAVQAFLNTKGANCDAASGNTCLKLYVTPTPTRLADSYCPGTYAGSASESAASIIAKAAVACGINPQVLLVLLQKEQSLVTAPAGKDETTYSKATGFKCRDGSVCVATYVGFANQVYFAARQFKVYATGAVGSYRPGIVNTILWHPVTDTSNCGTSQVFIENQATASLYDYTPYRPNAAALAAGYGTGDACSTYGNRNFYLYFRDWFGSSTQRAPIGSFDVIRDVGDNTVRVAGWALDRDVTTSIAVHAYVDGKAALAVFASRPRPDVAAAFGRGADHGFDATFRTGTGTHTVCLYGLDGNGGSNALIGCRTVTVVNTRPIGAIDLVRDVGSNTVQVGGWALDPDVTGPIAVHVYVDGKATLGVTAAGPRPDVEAAFHRGTNHGFDATLHASNGTHSVCLYAIDSNGGTNVLLGCRTVTVVNDSPIGAIDLVQPGAGTLRVVGWALDPDLTTSIAVHVYVDGTATAVLAAAGSRPDVATAFGRGPNHGFDSTFAAAAGAHNVCLYGIDGNGGTNALIGCRTASVR